MFEAVVERFLASGRPLPFARLGGSLAQQEHLRLASGSGLFAAEQLAFPSNHRPRRVASILLGLVA